MRKILAFIMACLAVPVMSQEQQQEETMVSVPSAQEQMLVYDNPQIPVYIGDITYEPLKKGQKTSNFLMGLLNAEVSVEDGSMVDGAKEALAGCLRDVNRFAIKTGEVSEADMGKCLVFSAKIVFCNFTEQLNRTVMDKEARIVAYITLTDPSTNRVMYSNQVTGYTWLSVSSTMAECRQHAQTNLWVDAAARMRMAYPLRGHMLEKGFEKGKKQKLQEFYIDLGTMHRTFNNSYVDVYIVKRIAGRIARQYLGSGKVVEVEGEDISLCKVTKNGELIKQAFDRGAEIAVQVY